MNGVYFKIVVNVGWLPYFFHIADCGAVNFKCNISLFISSFSLGQKACWIMLFLELNWWVVSSSFWLFSVCANVMDDRIHGRAPLLSLPACDLSIFSCKPTFFFLLEIIKITILPSLSNSQSDFSLLPSNSFHFSFMPKTLAFAGLTYLIRHQSLMIFTGN